MPDLATFFDRLDAPLTETVGPTDPATLVDDAAVDARGEAVRGIYAQRAERAGVDLDDLTHRLYHQAQPTAEGVLNRLEHGHDVGTDLLNLSVSVGLWAFLAGVLWEQQRHLPDMEA